MEIPEHLQKYLCSDYFNSEYAAKGYWCEDSQLWVVVPVGEIEELRDVRNRPLGFLAVGRPGVDGISFGYREDQPGLWAYYPMTGEFVYIATSIGDLVARWVSSTIIL